jgi:hypothetical protein
VEVTLEQIARALKGDIRGSQVLAAGPNHSTEDRSLSITLSDKADGGFIVKSFANDDWRLCKNYVLEKLGLPKFQPKGRPHNSEDIARLIQEAVASQRKTSDKAFVAAYDYRDNDGTLLYQVLRYENPKRFGHRQPDGHGGWIYKGTHKRVIYRWCELSEFPSATAFVCEGEKDADNVATLGICATTVASGKWTDDCIQALDGRDCWILEDNDDTGRRKALEAAKLLHPVANSVKIIRLPGLPEGGDVSDWLDAGHTKAEPEDVCYSTPDWEPESSPPTLRSEATSPSNTEGKPKQPTILDHRRHRDRTIHDWDDPDWSLLDTQRASLPHFPLEVLSPKLQEVIERTSKGAGVTHAHVVVPLIGISSGLIGYSRRVRATASWFQPATCWTALVGYSGTGKTPGLTVTRRAAKEVEQSRKKDEEERKRDHETKKVPRATSGKRKSRRPLRPGCRLPPCPRPPSTRASTFRSDLLLTTVRSSG